MRRRIEKKNVCAANHSGAKRNVILKFFGPKHQINTEKCLKIQNFILSYMSQKCMERVFWVQRMRRSPIWDMFSRFQTRIAVWTQKSVHFGWFCLKNQKNTNFWNFNCGNSGRNRPISADLFPGGPLSPKVFPNFFLCHRNKNWRFYSKKIHPPQKIGVFWGGSEVLFAL